MDWFRCCMKCWRFKFKKKGGFCPPFLIVFILLTLYSRSIFGQPFCSETILYNSIEGIKLIAIGERHDIKEYQEFKINFIERLIVNNKVGVIALEMPVSFQYYIDKYFETGDSVFIYNYFALTSCPSCDETKDKIKQIIRIKNLSCHFNRKVKVVCVDVEKNTNTFYRVLKYVDSLECINRNTTFFNPVKKYYSIEDCDALVKYLINKLDTTNYNQYGLNALLLSIKGYEKSLLKNKFNTNIREKFIVDNFKLMTKDHESDLIFCQFGKFHIVQKNDTSNCSLYNMPSFVSILNKDVNSPFYNKIMSVALESLHDVSVKNLNYIQNQNSVILSNDEIQQNAKYNVYESNYFSSACIKSNFNYVVLFKEVSYYTH